MIGDSTRNTDECKLHQWPVRGKNPAVIGRSPGHMQVEWPAREAACSKESSDRYRCRENVVRIGEINFVPQYWHRVINEEQATNYRQYGHPPGFGAKPEKERQHRRNGDAQIG